MSLDGLRGVAIACVLLTHAWGRYFPGGGIVGVDLFFGLSGFLITRNLARIHDGGANGRLRSFYLGRAYRLLPALYCMLALYVGAVAIFGRQLHRSIGVTVASAGYAIGYVFNLVPVFGLRWSGDLGALWTLSTEEQFYALWPLLLFAILAKRPGPRGLLGVFATLAAVTWVIRAVTFVAFGESIYVLPTTWIDTLILGGASGLLSQSSRLRPALAARPRLCSTSAVVVVAILAALVVIPDLKSRSLTYLLVLPLLSLLIPFLVLQISAATPTVLTRVLRLRPLTALGAISYSAYLYNYPCCAFVLEHSRDKPLAGAVATVSTLGLATASRNLVELPFMRRHARRRSDVRGWEPGAPGPHREVLASAPHSP